MSFESCASFLVISVFFVSKLLDALYSSRHANSEDELRVGAKRASNKETDFAVDCIYI